MITFILECVVATAVIWIAVAVAWIIAGAVLRFADYIIGDIIPGRAWRIYCGLCAYITFGRVKVTTGAGR